jgi:hypothetical protein
MEKYELKSVTDWFKSIEGKSKYTFISFDIVDFYPDLSSRKTFWMLHFNGHVR